MVPADIVLAVASMSCDIERHYGRPQDIEWAWAAGQLYVLQSRNIKTTDELAVDCIGLERWNKPPEKDEAEIVWTRAWSDEVLTRAITPLFYSVQADLITETYDFMYRASGMKQLLPLRLMRFHKNRGYFSTRYLMECLRYAPKFARGEDMLKFFTPEQREQVRAMPFQAWEKVKSELYLSLHYKKYTLTRCHKTFYDEWLPELLERVRKLDELDLRSATPEQLSEYCWAMDRLIKDHCQPIGFGVMVHTFATVTFLSIALEKWLGDSTAASVLLSGLPGNSTVALNAEVWKFSRRIKLSPNLHSVFVNSPSTEVLPDLNESPAGQKLTAELESFRRTYAFRGAEDREISFPRWGDDPVLLVNVLKLMLSAGDECEPEAALKKNAARRQALTAEIENKLSRQSWGSLKKKVFRFLLKYAQIYSLFRENQRFEVDRVFYGQRKAFLAIGRNLAQEKLLADPDDIWFLAKEEVFDLMTGKLAASEAERLITPRRAEYRKYLHVAPPMFLEGDREFDVADETLEASVTSGGMISGVAASAGRATGIARVVHDIGELGRVKPGDILVTNSTDPGWTPVFLLIKGLVLETGGILAHGTVLSREYGIPAVTSVRQATSLIKEGNLITIDGSEGSIQLLQGRPRETA
jgi:pyruvate,water dikinase